MTTQQANKHVTLEAKPHTVLVVNDPMVAFKNQSAMHSHRDKEPTAQTLPMFVELSTPIPAHLIDEDAYCKVDVFFDQQIQAETKALQTNDLDRTAVTARLLNFDGTPLGGWKNLTDASSLWDAELAFTPGPDWAKDEAWVAATTLTQESARFVAMLDVIESRSDEWSDSDINVNRCSANVWIERDRKVITLTNDFFGLEVFTLTDDAVDDAIDSGYLTPPRHPRPTDEDWVPYLVDYANSMGISLCGVYPQETGQAQEAEAPQS